MYLGTSTKGKGIRSAQWPIYYNIYITEVLATPSEQ